MRAVLGFFSMLALGVIVAAGLMTGMTNGIGNVGQFSVPGPLLDYMSVMIGLGIGVVIVVLSQIRWAELPHEVVRWVIDHARRLKLFAWGAFFVAILVYF